MVCDQASTTRHNRIALNMPEKTKRKHRTKSREEEIVVEVKKERKVRGTKSERGIESSALSDVARGDGSRASAFVVTPQYFGLSLMGARAPNSGSGYGHYSLCRHNPVAFGPDFGVG